MQKSKTILAFITLLIVLFLAGCSGLGTATLDARVIAKAANTKTTAIGDVVRINWRRDDVVVNIDGLSFPPAAGLGSWAAFQPNSTGENALLMGDTVVFQDEVDTAIDAVFRHGLNVTALHNHFFYDEPKVYFMHISGRGPAAELASGVKAVWDAIRQVRAANPQPATRFAGPIPELKANIDANRIESTTGLHATIKSEGIVKISTDRTGSMQSTKIGGAMGLSSWAAFSGSDELAVMDGDIIMTADEVPSVLKALRDNGVHIVALHNHMLAEQPTYYFTHFWGKGPAIELAKAFKAALEKQAQYKK